MIPKPAWAEGRGGRPEEYCHRDILDAIRYLVDNGVNAQVGQANRYVTSASCGGCRPASNISAAWSCPR
ncbi:hypothetical protein SCANM124S_04629 [Streptomyces canus]